MPIKLNNNSNHDKIIVNVKDVDCTYLKGKIPALSNISIQVKEAAITVIVGSNGSGKSTLLKSICGLIKIDRGRIDTLGINAQRGIDKLIPDCAYISQQPTTELEMTGKEVIDYFGCMYGLKKQTRLQRTRELLQLMNLEAQADKKVSRYSGGNLQKLHLAIGLIKMPILMLFDEPTNNLDTSSKHEFWSYIKYLVEDEHKSAIIISHDLSFVEKYSDNLIVLEEGHIVYQGKTKHLLQSVERTSLLVKFKTPIINTSKLKSLVANVVPLKTFNINKNLLQIRGYLNDSERHKLIGKLKENDYGIETVENMDQGLYDALRQLTDFKYQSPKEIKVKDGRRGTGRGRRRGS
ncbi:MAG: hypothetical protein CL862_00610 [Cyanobium sp. NAT70]|nr:hypothetical protein [Cyanobium sp. NAT70]